MWQIDKRIDVVQDAVVETYTDAKETTTELSAAGLDKTRAAATAVKTAISDASVEDVKQASIDAAANVADKAESLASFLREKINDESNIQNR